MTRTSHRIISICCVIAILSGVSGGCRRRPAETTPDASSVAEKQVRNALDDFFAYVKMARTDKVSAFCEEESAAEYIDGVRETVGEATLEAVCGRVGVKVTDVKATAEEADVDILLTRVDSDAVISEGFAQGGYADNRALKSAIDSASTVEKALSLHMIYSDSWKFDAESAKKILTEILGFLTVDGLIAPPEEKPDTPKKLNISVYDSYWVNTSGREVGGYHVSTEKVGLYVYTWNTYSNVDIGYEFVDEAGNVLYSNSFSMKNNTDWIACSWRPTSGLPEGDLTCRLYEPDGELFHESTVQIFPDGAKLPFPVTWMDTCYWVDFQGMRVDFYPADAPLIEYHAQALRFYEDMDLFYEFVDEDGNVLYNSKIYVSDLTDTFVFTWDREGLPPLAVKGVEIVPEEIVPDGLPIASDPSGATSSAGAESTTATGATSATTTKDTSATTAAPGAGETTAPGSSDTTVPGGSDATTVTEIPPEPTFITLRVTTTDGSPFCEVQIEIRAAEVEEVPAESQESEPLESQGQSQESQG